MTTAPTTLRDLVLERLDAGTKPEDTWSALVLAALEGQAELDTLLEEEKSQPARQVEDKAESGKAQKEAAPPRVAFLRSVTAEGFRGIGQKATRDLTPGPGLTLVVGRNGCGKSSFAEALELLLTGDTYRWENRSKVWRDGWRNLHHPQARPSDGNWSVANARASRCWWPRRRRASVRGSTRQGRCRLRSATRSCPALRPPARRGRTPGRYERGRRPAR